MSSRGLTRLRGASSGGLGRLGTTFARTEDLSDGWPEERRRVLPAAERVRRQQLVYDHVVQKHKDAPVTSCPLCAQRGVPLTMTREQAEAFVTMVMMVHPEEPVDREELENIVLAVYRAGRRDGWAMSRYRRIQRLRRAAR